jgi:hypothetical protein
MKNNVEGIISKTVMKDFQALAEALSPLERKIIVSFLEVILAVEIRI